MSETERSFRDAAAALDAPAEAPGEEAGVGPEAVDAALSAGATGAKIAGAGGGGFVLVVCPVEHQAKVRAALPALKELPIKVDQHGSRVIFNVHRDIWA